MICLANLPTVLFAGGLLMVFEFQAKMVPNEQKAKFNKKRIKYLGPKSVVNMKLKQPTAAIAKG